MRIPAAPVSPHAEVFGFLLESPGSVLVSHASRLHGFVLPPDMRSNINLDVVRVTCHFVALMCTIKMASPRTTCACSPMLCALNCCMLWPMILNVLSLTHGHTCSSTQISCSTCFRGRAMTNSRIILSASHAISGGCLRVEPKQWHRQVL